MQNARCSGVLRIPLQTSNSYLFFEKDSDFLTKKYRDQIFNITFQNEVFNIVKDAINHFFSLYQFKKFQYGSYNSLLSDSEGLMINDLVDF